MVCLQVGWLMASRNAACFGVLVVAELRVESGLDLDAQKSLLAGAPFPNYHSQNLDRSLLQVYAQSLVKFQPMALFWVAKAN